MSTDSGEMLKMSELSERSGVSAGTIKHYLREGLLGADDDVVRTSRNMAYYPPEFVERIQLIKRLQEERFMPLRVIRDVISESPERAARLIELEDRILELAIEARETGRASRSAVREAYEVPQNVLDRLEELGVLTPKRARLRRRRRRDHRGDLALSGRRLRGGDRLHGLRHDPVSRRAGATGRGGGAGAARAARGHGRRRAGGRDHLFGGSAACGT